MEQNRSVGMKGRVQAGPYQQVYLMAWHASVLISFTKIAYSAFTAGNELTTEIAFSNAGKCSAQSPGTKLGRTASRADVWYSSLVSISSSRKPRDLSPTCSHQRLGHCQELCRLLGNAASNSVVAVRPQVEHLCVYIAL